MVWVFTILASMIPIVMILGMLGILIYVIVKQVEKRNQENFEDRDN